MEQYLSWKTRGKHKKCPNCGENMKRLYIKLQKHKIKTMKGVGWWCPKCGHTRVPD